MPGLPQHCHRRANPLRRLRREAPTVTVNRTHKVSSPFLKLAAQATELRHPYCRLITASIHSPHIAHWRKLTRCPRRVAGHRQKRVVSRDNTGAKAGPSRSPTGTSRGVTAMSPRPDQSALVSVGLGTVDPVRTEPVADALA